MVKRLRVANTPVLAVKIGKLALKNPVIAASGTFGYGEEMAGFFDINKLGAIVTKTITLNPRKGNPTPRIVETPSGMLNSIGLENKGLKDFIFNKAGYLGKLDTAVIVSVAGHSIGEFIKLAEGLSRIPCVDGIELNLSCPNVEHKLQSKDYRLIAQDKNAAGKIISAVRKKTKLMLIAKLSPNVSNIGKIAGTAEAAGADAISAINTVFGMSVDIETRRPRLANIVGGLSGPAIKPIALNMVREIYESVNIPVIGMGGIMTAEDAIEFMLCGAAAVQVGTANFVNPSVSLDILDGIKKYMKVKKIKDVSSIAGTLKI